MAKENGGILLVEPDKFRASQVRSALKDAGLTVVAQASSLSGARYAIKVIDQIGFDAVVARGNLGRKGMGKGGTEDGARVVSMMDEQDPSVPTLLYDDVGHNFKPVGQRRIARVIRVGAAEDVPRLVTAVRGLSRPRR